MSRQLQAKIYNYSKGSLLIDDIKLNTEVINKEFPEYAIDNSIYSIYYEQGGKANYIKYKDGNTQELSDYEPYYEEQFSKTSTLLFKCKEHILLEKQKVDTNLSLNIYIKDILSEENPTKRAILKKEYEFERGSILLTKEKLFKFLNRYKRRRLKNSDWTQTADVQSKMSDELKTEWINYRQTLRTLNDVDDPIVEVILPKEPKNPLK